MKQRHSRIRQGEAFFISRSGKEMTEYGITHIFKALSPKLKLEGIRFSAHTFRHSFALNYIENGGDAFSLQKILGHTSQEMTTRYVNMAKGNLKKQHAKFSPGDRL